MHIIKYTDNATVCIDSQQNMYSCSKCVSWSFYLLYYIPYRLNHNMLHMEQVTATLPVSAKMPQIQS